MKKIISFLLVGLMAPSLVWAATATTKKISKPVTPTVTNIIVPEEEAVIKAYESTLPSVVNIVISEELKNMMGNVSKQDTGGGTGFFISSDGYILTNKHVVARDDVDYTVVTSDGREFTASVLGRDPLFDVAIVKIEGSGFKPAKLGDSDKIRISSSVLAIGNVLAEFRNTVTRGIVSGIGRTITASGGGLTETIEGAIQTDASINPGNSGGPLINLKGEVIGINTAINRAGESLGFAIPINIAKQALANFKKHGKIVRTFVGLRYVMLNRAIARAYGLPVSQGAYVLIKNNLGEPGVVAGGPAETAGVQLGDIVLEINGQKLSIQKSLASAIAQYEPAQKIKLKILRQGSELTLEATLGERTE
jgi:serine protease Do